MHEKEGPKRNGRFIKKGDKLLKAIALQPFSFAQITEDQRATFDNPEGSIIHVRFHDDHDLKGSVKEPTKFNESLIDPLAMRPIIMPQDFTADWRNARSQMGRRSSKDDDDDLDFASSESAEQAAQKEAQASASETQNQRNATKPAATVPAPSTAAAADAPTGFKFERIEQPSQAQPESLEQLRPQAQAFDAANVEKAAATMAQQEKMALETLAPAAAAQDFIPMNNSKHPEQKNPELPAIDEYKSRLAVQKINEKILAELADEAKADGFRDGFKAGEEKGEMQARQNAAAMFAKLSELVIEFEKLKHQILNNVQQNFYDLSQAMGEALLRREFDIHPESFAEVMRKAVAETVGTDSFKIKLHPESYDAIVKLEAPDILPHLQRDPSIPPGDFRIESHLTVLEASAHKVISTLLEKVDMSLFKEKGKAS